MCGCSPIDLARMHQTHSSISLSRCSLSIHFHFSSLTSIFIVFVPAFQPTFTCNYVHITISLRTDTVTYLTVSYLTVSYLTVSYLTVSSITVSYLTVSYLTVSYLTVSYLTVSYLTVSYLTVSYLTVSLTKHDNLLK